MKLSQFKFKLPEEKIALHPTKYRDESRLLVLHRKTGEIEHKMFKDVLDYFDDKDVFIFNDTKVFPARLYGNKEKTGARIEVFLLRELNEELRLWDVLVDPARKIRIGNKLYFGDDDSMVAEVIDNTTSRGRTLRFLYDGPHDEFKKALYALGETPLPHSIINRPVEPDDAERFQSIFARNEGAVTAPTASLHFSRELMKRMEIKGIDFAYVTLHAGLGNFRDIDVEDLTKHKTDSEQMIVDEEAVRIVNHAKDLNRQVCAVGTTVMRAIESTVSTDGHLKEYEGWTNKFIFPPYDFTVANTSNVPLDNYYWHDRIPTDAARATAFTTGTYSARLNYRILYKTNYSGAYQVLASNLITSSNYSFSLNAIPMQAGEYVTDVYLDFGKVPVGFQSVANPTLTVTVSGTAANGYQLINRADVGGKYQGAWQTAQATWLTVIRKLTPTYVPTLPKTGY